MEKNVENVKAAQEKFGELIQSEFERIERMKTDNEVTDFDKLEKIVIGVHPERLRFSEYPAVGFKIPAFAY